MPKSPLLSIIIVSYNTKHLTLQTIESAWADAQHSKLLKNTTEIIVVDNDSKDDTVKELKKLKKTISKLKIIESKKNLGFAGGNNLGLKKAEGEYLLLLNSDTIVQEQALKTMVELFEQLEDDLSTAVLSSELNTIDRLGIMAATLLNEDGTLQAQGGSYPNLFSLACQMLMLDDIPLLGKLLPSIQHTGLRQTESFRHHTGSHRLIKRDWVGGTAMMIKRQVIDEIGMLDEKMFMYGEDVEYCMRAGHHHWDVAIHPQAKITHIGMGSSNPANALKGEFIGLLYIWSKHKSIWQAPAAQILLMIGAMLRIIVFSLIGQRDKAETYREIFYLVLRNER